MTGSNKTRRASASNPKPRPTASTPGKPQFEIVDPIWLLKALGVAFGLALVCGYGTLCFLVYQGEWQLILHPVHTVARTPADSGLAFSPVHFDSTETGQPRLTGWWIPAAASGLQPSFASSTLLYLHGGSGSLSDTLPVLKVLHQAGLNIFAIDYRGFGASDSSAHPTAESMAQDAAAALNYLTGTRHIPPQNIVPYGVGLGASLAVNLAQANSGLPAVILDNPNPDPAATAVARQNSNLVPVRLLFGSQFNIATPLASLATPKLLIAGGPSTTASVANSSALQTLFAHAASPRTSVTLPAATSSQSYLEALSRFLDQYLAASASAPASVNARSAP